MLNYARRLRTLDDVRTVAENGLSAPRVRGMVDAILARLGHPLTDAGREWHETPLPSGLENYSRDLRRGCSEDIPHLESQAAGP